MSTMKKYNLITNYEENKPKGGMVGGFENARNEENHSKDRK